MTKKILRILVVEDEERFAKLFEKTFVAEGYTPKIVKSFKQLNHVEGFNPNMLIVNAFAFGKKSLEIAEYLNKKFPLVPLIIISALPSMSTCINSYALGASNFIDKSTDVHPLVEAVNNFNDMMVIDSRG